jgi:hypothetical protein
MKTIITLIIRTEAEAVGVYERVVNMEPLPDGTPCTIAGFEFPAKTYFSLDNATYHVVLGARRPQDYLIPEEAEELKDHVETLAVWEAK